MKEKNKILRKLTAILLLKYSVSTFLLIAFRLILTQGTTQALTELRMAFLSLIFPLRMAVV